MVPGSYTLCYQLGSCRSRWCTSTLKITSTSWEDDANVSQLFKGICYNDDESYGTFISIIEGEMRGRRVVWRQFIPVTQSYDINAIFFSGRYAIEDGSIRAGRIHDLPVREDCKSCHGIFTARRLLNELLNDTSVWQTEMPPNGVRALLLQHGCTWWWWTNQISTCGAPLIQCWLSVPGLLQMAEF